MGVDVDDGDRLALEGTVTTRVWRVKDLERERPNWSNLPRETRHTLLSRPSEYPASPVHEGTSSNMVVDNYLEALAAGENPDLAYLALGDDTTAPQATNNALNNEVYRAQVGTDEGDNRDRVTSTFLSQNEANGETLAEIGFVTAQTDEDWTLLTHAVLDSTDQYTKTSNMVITYNYVIEWRRVS